MSYYLISLLAQLPIFIILGISFNLLLGYGGLLSVSHAGFFGVGAYAAALLMKDYHLEFLPAALIGAFIAGISSLAIGYAAGRLSDEFLFIVTIAVQVLLYELFNNLEITGRSAGLSGIPRPTVFGIFLDSNVAVGALAWISCGIIAFIGWRLVRSPFGRQLEAIREDVPASRSIGKRALRTKVTVFALSAGLAGFAGALFATYIRYISPMEFTVDRSVEILSLTIIGGLGAYWGPFLGAFLVVAIPEALSFAAIPDSVAGPINGIVYSGLVLLLLIFRPQGLLGKKKGQVKRRRLAAAKAVEEASSLEKIPPSELAALQVPIGRPGMSSVAERAKVLRCEGLNKSFGGLKAVDDVTLQVRPGQITALVGPNGAGKTTVFNLLSGALTADSGRTFYGDLEITNASIEKRAALGVVRSFQEVRLFEGLTVLDNVKVALTEVKHETIIAQFLPSSFGRRRDRQRQEQAEQMLTGLGLIDKKDGLAGDLSYAEQKLLMMGRLLATGASCYLLDEPMSGLDQLARQRLSALLRQMVADGTAICLVEHSMQVIREVSSWVVFLDHGKVLTEGSPEDVINDPELTSIYFGHPV